MRSTVTDVLRVESLQEPDQTGHEMTGAQEGWTVLVVEDSEVIRRVMSLILESEGYRVFEAPEGQRAAELARQLRPDVITLDLSLPDVDGRELLHELAADAGLRGVPIVVISAYADTLTSHERWQAADVIVKPFDLDDLLARLRRVIQRGASDAAGIGAKHH